MSVEKMYESMKAKLSRVVPDIELRYKAELADEIMQLKKERNAVVLAHNYMEPALFYSIPDYSGDSLDLSRKAATADADTIVFCGVRFMAETAKILSPDKTVLIPAERAGCSLAESITAEDVRALKEQLPGVPVVTYVNTYADVKAETDICCTSTNAVDVVRSLNTDTVIFLPDQYLGSNVARELGMNIVFPEMKDGKPVIALEQAKGKMIGWKGSCEVHERFLVKDIENARRQFPNVKVLAHPECTPEVVEASDFAGSTNAMINYVQSTDATQFLVLTECAMGDNIAAANPDKEMIRICSLRCSHMNEITLEDTRDALLQNRYVVEVDPAIADKARSAVERMIQIG